MAGGLKVEGSGHAKKLRRSVLLNTGVLCVVIQEHFCRWFGVLRKGFGLTFMTVAVTKHFGSSLFSSHAICWLAYSLAMLHDEGWFCNVAHVSLQAQYVLYQYKSVCIPSGGTFRMKKNRSFSSDHYLFPEKSNELGVQEFIFDIVASSSLIGPANTSTRGTTH